jgi:hypothetical protein
MLLLPAAAPLLTPPPPMALEAESGTVQGVKVFAFASDPDTAAAAD